MVVRFRTLRLNVSRQEVLRRQAVQRVVDQRLEHANVVMSFVQPGL